MPSSSGSSWTAHRLDDLVLSSPERLAFVGENENMVLWCYPDFARQRLAARLAALLSRNGGVLRHADWCSNITTTRNGTLSSRAGGGQAQRRRRHEQVPPQHKRVREFFNQAVLEVACFLRHVTIRADLLSSNKLTALAQALRTSPHLTSLTWQGHGEGLSQKIATVLMMGVVKNPHGNFRTLKIMDVTNNGTATTTRNTPTLRAKVLKALGQLGLLQELIIEHCGMDVMDLVLEGLHGNASLQRVVCKATVPGERHDNALRKFLASLPHLKSLETNCLTLLRFDEPNETWFGRNSLRNLQLQSIGRGSVPGLCELLRQTLQLRHVYLYLFYDPDEQVLYKPLLTIIAALPHLESLYLSFGLDQTMDAVLANSTLRHVECHRAVVSPQHLEQLVTLRNPASLVSIHLNESYATGGEDFTTLPEALRTLCHTGLEALSIPDKRYPPRGPGMTALNFAALLQELLLSNSATLQSLSLTSVYRNVVSANDRRLSRAVVYVLTQLLTQNALPQLATLRVENIQSTDALQIVRVASQSANLRKLEFQGATSALVEVSAWVNALRTFDESTASPLRELVLDFDCRYSGVAFGENAFDVDEWAGYLENNNTHLTKLCVRLHPQIDTKLDFICRLFARRNQMKRLMKQEAFSDNPGLWAPFLESMGTNPSAIFLVVNHVPWPTTRRKRKLPSTK